MPRSFGNPLNIINVKMLERVLTIDWECVFKIFQNYATYMPKTVGGVKQPYIEIQNPEYRNPQS